MPPRREVQGEGRPRLLEGAKTARVWRVDLPLVHSVELDAQVLAALRGRRRRPHEVLSVRRHGDLEGQPLATLYPAHVLASRAGVHIHPVRVLVAGLVELVGVAVGLSLQTTRHRHHRHRHHLQVVEVEPTRLGNRLDGVPPRREVQGEGRPRLLEDVPTPRVWRVDLPLVRPVELDAQVLAAVRARRRRPHEVLPVRRHGDVESQPLVGVDPANLVTVAGCGERRDIDVVGAIVAAGVAGGGVVVPDTLAAGVVVLGLDADGGRDHRAGQAEREREDDHRA